METIKYDTFRIEPRKMRETAEGFLTGDAIVTRIGLFKYGKQVEFRSPEEVFKEDSLETMRLVPMTLGHPREFVTPENAKRYAVGYLGDDIKVDGDNVIASYRITDPNAIKQIKTKKKIELSMGYLSNDIQEPGHYKNDAYDVKQSNIRYNHCAIVTKGRAGNTRFILDAAEEVYMDGVVKLDGISYEVPRQVENAFEKMTEKIDSVSTEKESLTKEIEVLKAKVDGLDAELKKAKEVDIDSLVKAKTDSLLALRMQAKELAPELKFDGLSEREIKVNAIKVVKNDFEDAEKSDAYIDASFDFYLGQKKNDSAQKQADEILKGNDKVKKDSKISGRELMIHRLKNGGKDANSL